LDTVFFCSPPVSKACVVGNPFHANVLHGAAQMTRNLG
jgi:hypothetical protein